MHNMHLAYCIILISYCIVLGCMFIASPCSAPYYIRIIVNILRIYFSVLYSWTALINNEGVNCRGEPGSLAKKASASEM